MDCLAEYAKGNYHSIEIGEGIYKIPNHSTFSMPQDVVLRIYGVPNKSVLKFWKENTFEPCPVVFNIKDEVYVQDVDFKAPDEAILTTNALTYNLFNGGRMISSTDENTAPCIAIVNSKSDFGLGTISFSGAESFSSLLAKPAYGFIYLENYHVKGINLLSFNANWSGGGVYFGTQNCTIATGSQNQYAVTKANFKFTFSDDGETLKINGKDTHSASWPIREAYTSRSAIFQVKGKNDDNFVFILPNKEQIQTYLQQINGRSANPSIQHETETDKMLCGHIPKVGDVVTLQREYETDISFDDVLHYKYYTIPDKSKVDFDCRGKQAVRSHICYSTTENKYGSELEGVKQNGIYLQIDDVIEDKSTGIKHTVTAVTRGYYDVGYDSNASGYCMEYKAFKSDKEATSLGFNKIRYPFVYQSYILSPPLSANAPMLNDFVVIKSRANYLLDGEFDGELSWKSNTEWKQNKVNGYLPPANNVVAHTMYCQRELNHNHRNSVLGGDGEYSTYYRENNMNYEHMGGQEFTLNNGEKVRALGAYPYFGSQHINTTVFGGQYGSGYGAFMPQRAAIIEQEDIDEDFACMQRNIGEVNQEQKVANPYYTETEIRPRPKRLLDFLKENKR